MSSAGEVAVADVRLSRARAEISRQVDGETFIYETDSRRLFVLDRIGSVVWQLLEEPMRLTDLCTALADAFSAEVSRVADDVGPLLHTLVGGGLLLAEPLPVPAAE